MKQLSPQKQRGFVFIELVVVMGILSLLLGIVIVNIGNVRSSASVNTTVTTFISDIKNQQTKAMTGDTEGRGIADTYSISIQPSQYILFHGQIYNPSDTTNFSVPIDATFQLSTTFPSNTIIFATSSGQITNYISGQDTVVIRDPRTNEQKTIRFNKLGSVVSVN
jgi:prepilin-type N-terminal cleavage/methylation domain-containing protein